MKDEIIALRLVEAWARQPGIPATIDKVINTYEYTLERIKNKEAE